jgi:O-acetyl-ADP-ribose deacetylase (regulator of RNase III)
MTIYYLTGDATAPAGAGQKIIVHVCNDIGRWGKGFVLALSERWPEPERSFKAAFANGRSLPLGAVQFVPVTSDVTVANVVAQHKIATRSTRTELPPIRYPAVAEGLAKVAAYAQERQASVHMPRIGCGLAGGKWELIEPLIVAQLVKAGVAVFVYDFA